MKAKTKNIKKAAAQVIIINNELTDAEIQVLQDEGIFPDMSPQEAREDTIEGGLWVEIRNQRPTDLLALKDVIQEYTEWNDRDASAFARSIWKAAQKMMGVSRR